MKKILLGSIITSLLVLFTACSGENEKSSGSGNETVDFFSDKVDDEAAYSEISELINEDIGVELNFVGYSDTTAFQTAVQQSLGQENSPGMFTWWSGYRMEDIAKSGNIEDLTSEWEEYYIPAGVNPDLAEAFKVDGKIYGAPATVLYNGIYYNQEIFEKYNLEVPKTFDEFLALCETLKSEDITPIGMQDAGWASFLWFQQLIAAYNPELYTSLVNGEISYQDEQVVEVMEIWQSMLDNGYFAEPVDHMTRAKQFSNGDVAMTYESTRFTKNLEEDFGLEAEKDYSRFILPSMESSQKPVIFYETSPIAISSASSEKDNAIKILREYYGEEQQQAYADQMGIGFLEGVELGNETNQNITEKANSDDHLSMIRYYEATPATIVDAATTSLWEFVYDPSTSSIENTLKTIQAESEKAFSN
ncbi:multiple sugar transport system substrate-binding protein [Gracilibacillus orientalis]|uniref:Multiple sugar transport system substrate-binding protein n=1 Tax=Gracilibacillus orientalis TaxID=334253 RepID=A0A1I4K140_9BACI|nr:ABC transporter substrate-binding protein [Gracilibacillus orientalis]SFL72515.1 multiple sugar transport system substrate-binding protein [Gracilibacillus orientalis]